VWLRLLRSIHSPSARTGLADQSPRAKVVRPAGRSTLTRGLCPATQRVADGERMNPHPQSARSRQHKRRRAPGRRRQQEASCTAAEYSNPPPPTAALANCRHHGYARAGEHRRDPADNLQLDGVVHLCARTGGKLRSRVANHGHRKPPLTWACAGRSRARSELLSSRSRVRKLQAACQLNSQHLLAVHVVLWLASGAKVISPNVHYLLEGSDQRSPRDPDKGAGYESVMVVLTLCSVVDAYR